MKRGYSPEEGSCFVLPLLQEFYSTLAQNIDPVMAEYITIMLINNKTAGV